MKPKALRKAVQAAERRTASTGSLWVVVEDRSKGPHVSPYRVKPADAVTEDEVVVKHGTGERLS